MARNEFRAALPGIRAETGWSGVGIMREIRLCQDSTQEQKLRAPIKRDRRAHSKQLSRVQCLRDYRSYSFLPRTIPDWNDSLTEAVAGATSLDVFTSGARKLHQ